MRIGISGSIGTGKSTAAHYLAEKYHLKIFDADKYGHRLYNIFSPAFYQILRNFKTANRSKIASTVFEDEQKLRLLNRITHPEIFKMISREISENSVIEATLLHQIGLDRLTQLDVLMVSRSELINRRLKLRGYDQAELKKRKKAMPKFDPKKFDIIIENNDGLKELYHKLDKSLSKYF